jgi:hypothetical protein
MLIGTSFGRCLTSILSGEVSYKDVFCIISRTKCHDLSELHTVIESYRSASMSRNGKYNSSAYPLEEAIELATSLYVSGKIHQPRLYDLDLVSSLHSFDLNRDVIWYDIVPTLDNNTPAVVDAYNKYRMLDSLTK